MYEQMVETQAPMQRRGAPTWLGRPFRRASYLTPPLLLLLVFWGGLAAHESHIPWLWSMLITPGLALVLAALLVTAGARIADACQAYLATLAVFAVTWVMAVGEFGWANYPAMATWVVALTLYGAGWRPLREHQIHHEDTYWWQRTNPAIPQQRQPEPDDEWEAELAAAGCPGMKTLNPQRHPNGSMSVLMQLPAGGKVKFSTLVDASQTIEINMGLAHGSVSVERPRNAAGRTPANQVIIHIDVEDVLSQLLPLPDDDQPLTITQAFTIGKYSDGRALALTLQEIHYLIIALTGSGKSNLLNVIIDRLTRCRDVFLVVIDPKGGRLIRPWLRPWLEGKTRRPVLGCVATTPAQAWKVLCGIEAVVDYRSRAGLGNDEKVEPSRDLPAILLVVDELPMLVGAGARTARWSDQGVTASMFAAKFAGTGQTGRSEGVWMLLASQRAVAESSGGTMLTANLAGRIGLGVTSEQEARSVFPDDSVAPRLLARFATQGIPGALLEKGGKGSRLTAGKAYRMEPGTIPTRAEAHTEYPADLDAGSEHAWDLAWRQMHTETCVTCQAGEDCDTIDDDAFIHDPTLGLMGRWSVRQAGHLYSGVTVPATVPDGAGGRLARARTAAAPPAAPVRPAYQPRFFRYTQPGDGDTVVAAPGGESAPASGEAVDEEWESIVAAFHAPAVGEQVVESVVQPDDGDRYRRVVARIHAAGTNGMTSTELIAWAVVEGLITVKGKSSLYRWVALALGKDGGKLHPSNRTGRPEIRQPAGPRGRYYAPWHAGGVGGGGAV